MLASCSGYPENAIKLWDTNNGDLLRTINDPFKANKWIHSVAFDRGNLIASASGDKYVKVWDKNSGKYKAAFSSHTDEVKQVVFSRYNLLASASFDRTIKLWDKYTGALSKTLIGHTDRVQSVAFNGDNLLATSSSDKTIKIWTL
jgi:WD40 repeat protein